MDHLERKIMDLTVEIYDEILRKFQEKREEIAAEDPPNETQEFLSEGAIIGLDLAQTIVKEVFGK